MDGSGTVYQPEEGVVDQAFSLDAPVTLQPDECLPERGGVADQAVAGVVIPFTLPRAAITDRPLFLVLPGDVTDGEKPPPRIQLDV